jgi:sensor domain CHASE-containing protein
MTDTLNKEEYVEKLCDAIVDSMDRTDLKRVVWDQIYEEMSSQEWPDLLLMGGDYGIETES